MDESLQMDAVGRRLLQRIKGLLATRPELQERAVFGHRIGRTTPSWLSEFLSGKRTTNDLRLVITIAKVFGVSVGYLLGEVDPERDEGAATLLATYDAASERDRRILLAFSATLRSTDGESPSGDDGDQGGGDHNTGSISRPQKRKR